MRRDSPPPSDCFEWATLVTAIGLDHPIFRGIDLANLHWGPGHWPGTADPGEPGNSVFAGHRVTHTRPFLEIDTLVPGDEIRVGTTAGTFTYRVTGHRIVAPTPSTSPSRPPTRHSPSSPAIREKAPLSATSSSPN